MVRLILIRNGYDVKNTFSFNSLNGAINIIIMATKKEAGAVSIP